MSGSVSVVRGGIGDPIAFQEALRRRNADLKKSIFEGAFTGSGHRDEWVSATRTVAVQTAMYATGVNLDLNRQRHDPPEIQQQDVQALAAEDRRATDDVKRLVSGSAGLQDWFKRAQELGFVAAAHAARASELCDASTVEPIAREVREGMEAALSSAAGSGGVDYWADLAGNAAIRLLQQTRMTSLSGVAAGALSSTTPAGAPDASVDKLRGDLRQLGERRLSSLNSLAFGLPPDTTSEALANTLLAGTHALEFSGRVSIHAARVRHDLQPPDEAVMADLASRADEEILRAASLGLQGSGTAQYWFECNAIMAGRASAHAALVATHCNEGLAEAVRPQVLRLLNLTPTGKHGDAHIWMQTAETTAHASIDALQQVSVELRAAAAAQRVRAVQAAPPDVAVEEKQRLEVDKALQEARMTLWDEALQRRGRDLSQLQTRINDFSAQMRPLADQQAKLDRKDSVISRVGLGGIGTVLGGLVLSAAWQTTGLGVAAAGAAVAVGAFIANVQVGRQKRRIADQREPLEKAIEDLTPAFVTARTLANAAHQRREEAERALRAVDGQLDIHHMADAVTSKPGDAKIEVDEDTVRIGDVVIRRKRLSNQAHLMMAGMSSPVPLRGRASS